MNAVLFFVTEQFRLTGSMINAIEYFLAGFEHNPELKLVLINGTKSIRRKIMYLIVDRYDIRGMTHAMHNIVCMNRYYIPHEIYDTILVLDYVTISMTKGILRAKKILVISEKYTELPKYFYDKSLYNVEYFGEMPFHYKDHKYRMKCLFNRYKPLKNVQAGTYVNSPRNNEDFSEVMFALPHLPKPFIFKSKTKPEENLFEKFTHYLYYHVDKWFDPHPRLFLECTFYNKCITYKNPYKVKDGSYYRYEDILHNKLHDRTLSDKDEIIRRLV